MTGMNTDSEIWKALHAMSDASKSSATDVLVARALNELDAKDAEIARLKQLLDSAGGEDPTLRLSDEKFEAVKQAFSKPQKATPALKALLSPATPGGDTISRALHRRELAEKDVTIKALADALEGTCVGGAGDGKGSPCWCLTFKAFRDGEEDHDKYCRPKRAALRLAGRLP